MKEFFKLIRQITWTKKQGVPISGVKLADGSTTLEKNAMQ